PPPFGPVAPAPPVRVESEPEGAAVFLDLVEIGKTPLDLPLGRDPAALVDIELAGHAKVHRAAPAPGTLAVALGPGDPLAERVAERVDRLRAAGELAEAELAELGRAVGAARLLVARYRGGVASVGGAASAAVEVRVLDVGTGRWSK